MAEAIEFYFDFTSPYAYFASLNVDEIGQRQGRDVIWKPVCYPENSMPTTTTDVVNDDLSGARALQAEYVLMDTARVARLHRLELNLAFPLATSYQADCVYIWLFDQAPRVAKNFAQAVFHAHWRLGQNIEDAGLLGDCAAAAGQDPNAIKICLEDETSKIRVYKMREKVYETGVFAAPTLNMDGQLFWGWDRMAMAEAWLEHGGW